MKISKKQLKELTDERSWKRGIGYYQQGNVLSLLEDKNTIIAKVSGRHNYTVKLWMEDDELDGSCTCPMGDAGVFCKHCVAAGLTYLDDVDSAIEGSSARKAEKSKPAITLDNVRQYLAKQKTNVLVEIIIAQMLEDESLRERLMMRTVRFGQEGLNMSAFKQTITQATNTHGFVDYHSSYDFSKRIDNVVDSIEELLTEGYAQEVVGLAEHALGRVEKAIGQMDDSDGYMSDILERLQEIHHKACVRAKPDPESLAKRLFKWELTTDWDTFYGAVETYLDVLGEKGLAIYRKLAEVEWAKIPQLQPGQTGRSFQGSRFRLTSIMEAFGRIDGDVEALVAVKSRDLSLAYHYLEIAQIYKNARKSDKALVWAEKGLKAFPEDTDSRLREFLANEYHLRKRHGEAMELIWANFLDRPGLENYKVLREHANRIKKWPRWRQQALEHIRVIIAGAKKRPQAHQYWANDLDRSMLVEIFIWEKDIEAAWHEAQTGGCGEHLWMQLAKLREKDHPADAIAVYEARIEPIINRTNNNAYREAIGLIRKIDKLMKQIGQGNEFQEYVLSLRTKYKRKRNFIAMLVRLR